MELAEKLFVKYIKNFNEWCRDMSRIGKKPVSIKKGVTVELKGNNLSVKGPKGSLSFTVPYGISVEIGKEELVVRRSNDSKSQKALHGLTRSLIQNMVMGVTEGYKKQLDLYGVGYKAEVKGKNLELGLGYSHPVIFEIPEGISIKVEKQTGKGREYQASIIVEGIDKQLVGQVAANIRFLRKPDAYKGKGLRYSDEIVRLKQGKKSAK